MAEQHPVVVTEEFLRNLVDSGGASHAISGLHSQIDAMDGAVGRRELARLAEEARLRAIGQSLPDAPTGEAPPGWRKLDDGRWVPTG